jgi:hypothetical protein
MEEAYYEENITDEDVYMPNYDQEINPNEAENIENNSFNIQQQEENNTDLEREDNNVRQMNRDEDNLYNNQSMDQDYDNEEVEKNQEHFQRDDKNYDFDLEFNNNLKLSQIDMLQDSQNKISSSRYNMNSQEHNMNFYNNKFCDKFEYKIDKFEKMEEDRISKNESKASNASLLKELEEKWLVIEKEKKIKSRQASQDNIISKNKTTDSGNLKGSKSSVKLQQTQYQTHNRKLNTLEKDIKKIFTEIRTKGKNEPDQFDEFIKNKSKILSKFKKPYLNTNLNNNQQNRIDIDLLNFESRDLRYENSNNNENLDQGSEYFPNGSIVYEKNSSTKNRPSYSNERPSFLKNNSSQQVRIPAFPLFNSKFQYDTTNINNLVHESGVDPSAENTELQPSKHLISKMQNLFNTVNAENPRYKSSDKNHEYQQPQQESFISTERREEPRNIQAETESNLNNINLIDKTFTLNNLEKNFENIFTRINPNFKKEKLDLHFSNKSKALNNENINSRGKDEEISIHKIRNRRSIATNNEEENSISGGQKIFKKINENTVLLKNLFSLTNVKKEEPVQFKNYYSISTTSSSLSHNKFSQQGGKYNFPTSSDRICSQNNFDSLRHKMATVNNDKIKRFIEMNK